MSAETQAASSPAEVDVFGGQEPTMAEYSSFRETGKLPARFEPAVPAESAPADAPQETVAPTESASDSESEEVQEPPKGSPAQKRILQLLARVKELERSQPAKPDAAPAPSPEQQPPPAQAQNFQEWQKAFKPSEWSAAYYAQHPEANYEDAAFAMAVHVAEAKDVFRAQEQHAQAQLQVLKSGMDEARTRYPDADTVIFPAVQTVHDAHIPPVIKEVFAQSEHFIDLCYKVGSDPAEMAAFLALAQTNPRAALAKVFEYEREIAEKLTAAGKEPTGKAPEKKQTTAPKPPSPVSGGSSRAFDVNDETLSADAWHAKRNKQVGKG